MSNWGPVTCQVTAEIAWAPYLLGAGNQTLADNPERIAAAVTRGHVLALPPSKEAP